ncbi:transcription factor Ouib isoform X2 [Drosophila hydei]|uniref:Transcription factor Ouib isoform X2 n=1 Tax=Drosophila hydei TaxID=7224 RepID=A0A6J1MLL3_DROHY|nr:transcription factor Ouib isoform X2 [Drosophila hydei]
MISNFSFARKLKILIFDEHDTKLFEELNYHLVILIEDITDLWIKNDNTMPEYICIGCKSMLEQIFKFRTICLDTHKKLIGMKRKTINSSTLLESPEVNIVLDFNTIDAITESSDSCDDQVNINLCSDTQSYRIETVAVPQKRKPRAKVKRIYESKQAKTWICEQCGGVFSCSTYLKLHMLRHTGTKEFECDICKRRYYTRNEMERHKILHSNARPYACRFCDKTFRGTSSKTVHERTHTNERPFGCQYCDKAFRSTSVRKMHERVHVNNRNYHCEPCDQWFLRPSHLLLHQRTKLHKSKTSSD